MKVYFSKVYFSKVYFPKVYFLKVCTPKFDFSKVYFSKVYFCKMYPTASLFYARASLMIVFQKKLLLPHIYATHPGAPQAKSDAFRASAKRKMSITSSAATMRVLSVLRHWVTKHGQVLLNSGHKSIPFQMCVWQDFEGNPHLKNLSIEFLEDIVCTPTLLPAEHKAASQLLRSLSSS